jgi:hypothetical protein
MGAVLRRLFRRPDDLTSSVEANTVSVEALTAQMRGLTEFITRKRAAT